MAKRFQGRGESDKSPGLPKVRFDRDMAELRRRSLTRFMRENELEAAAWARMAGLSNANAIYNFLNGRSGSLSQDTARRLADAVPGATVSDLFGETALKKAGGPLAAPAPILETVTVKSSAESNVWRRVYDIPTADQHTIEVVPLDVPVDEAVMVNDRHCDQICPPGGYVLVSRSKDAEPLKNGDVCVVLRRRKRNRTEDLEVTLRRLVIKAGGPPRLVYDSSDTSFATEIDVPRKELGLNTSFTAPVPEGMTQYTYSIIGVGLQVVMPPFRRG